MNRKEDLRSHLDDFLRNNDKPQTLVSNNISTIRSSIGNDNNLNKF